MTPTTDKPHIDRYNTLMSESRRYGEHNDCSVIAIAMIYELSYNEAHKVCFDHGRRARRGFYVNKAIKALGRTEKEYCPKQPNDSRYTVKTIGDELTYGKYFVFVSGHVLALIDGIVYDWTEDRKHRVTSVIQVDKIELFDLL